MDYTSNHSFWVQSVGDSGWSSPALGVTGSGTDNNGATSDVCIQVPSENCVVRGSMYVSPMGRDVIFYLYPSDFTAGNTTDMNATMVTAAAGTDRPDQYRRTGIDHARSCGRRRDNAYAGSGSHGNSDTGAGSHRGDRNRSDAYAGRTV